MASAAAACAICRPAHRVARAAVARRGDANALRPLPATAAALATAGVRWRLRCALSQLVKRFKFHHAPELAPALTRLMLLRWQLARREQYLNRPDLILAVPLHASRCWRRGYNQSDLLARPLARWLGCPIGPPPCAGYARPPCNSG